MTKYTNARYPDKINDLVDNDGNVHIPGGVGSLPAIQLDYSFEELQVENSDARKYFSDLVKTLCTYFSDNSKHGLLRIVTTDNVYIEATLNNPHNTDNEETNLVAWKDDKLYMTYGIFTIDDESGAVVSFNFDEFWEIEFPEPPVPDPELNFEHKMTLKVMGINQYEVNVDGSSFTLDDNDKIQLFRAPASIGYLNDVAKGHDPQIYLKLDDIQYIQHFIEDSEVHEDPVIYYEVRQGEQHRKIEGEQAYIFRLPKDKDPCPAETLGLDAYDLYVNDKTYTMTFFWNGNAEEITWQTQK